MAGLGKYNVRNIDYFEKEANKNHFFGKGKLKGAKHIHYIFVDTMEGSKIVPLPQAMFLKYRRNCSNKSWN
jgi:hypothetical protein